MSFRPTLLQNNEYDELSFEADDIKEDKGCTHHFVRVSATRVECTKCHVGLIDSPDAELPLDALNEFYEDPKNQAYFKNL